MNEKKMTNKDIPGKACIEKDDIAAAMPLSYKMTLKQRKDFFRDHIKLTPYLITHMMELAMDTHQRNEEILKWLSILPEGPLKNEVYERSILFKHWLNALSEDRPSLDFHRTILAIHNNIEEVTDRPFELISLNNYLREINDEVTHYIESKQA